MGTNKPNHDGADMASDRDFEQLYNNIHSCRKCPDVVWSIVPRRLDQVACGSSIVLMAQAPSEGGVRKSGVHWVGADGRLRRPGGTFLDKYLRQLGYSVDPKVAAYTRPYTTNVLHCWTGRSQTGNRDRKPTQTELQNCMPWWRRELQLVKPRVIILLGQPAAESFESIRGEHRSFRDLLSSQGERMEFGGLAMKRYVVPQPTAPYPGKSTIYQEVIDVVILALKEKDPTRP